MLTQLYAENENRRDRVQILSDIIRVTENPVKITKILRIANIQYNNFQGLIDMLIKADLIEKIPIAENSREIKSFDQRTLYVFRATKTGQEWCNLVDEIYHVFRQKEKKDTIL